MFFCQKPALAALLEEEAAELEATSRSQEGEGVEGESDGGRKEEGDKDGEETEGDEDELVRRQEHSKKRRESQTESKPRREIQFGGRGQCGGGEGQELEAQATSEQENVEDSPVLGCKSGGGKKRSLQRDEKEESERRKEKRRSTSFMTSSARGGGGMQVARGEGEDARLVKPRHVSFVICQDCHQ